MDLVRYLFSFLYRIRYWLLIIPIIITGIVFLCTRNQNVFYQVKTSIYTGVISGQNTLLENLDPQTSNAQSTMLENLVNIMTSSETLKKVSIRLYAQNMINGDINKDNNYIKAETFKELMASTPKDVLALIDKNSEEKTVQNLLAYEKTDPHNFVYGLFNWNHPHYSYGALSAIEVKRVGTSDILEVSYQANDPGIAYNTLKILNEEFVHQYEKLKFGGTDDIINFFEKELQRVSSQLKVSEDSLTMYNVEKKVINYGEQTKQIAAMTRDFSLEYEQNQRDYSASKAAVEALEKRIGNNAQLIKSNAEFISKLNNISDLTTRITEIETLENDSIHTAKNAVNTYKNQLKSAKSDFINFSESFYQQKYSKEGYPSEEIIEEWLSELLKLEQAEAQKKILEEWKNDLDKEYSYYSPIGATLKRKEREINFTETSYLAILKGLHDAILRQKSMQMTTSTLKVLNPPTFPLMPVPTKRKMVLLAAFFASFIFVLGYFLLLEFLDQTLRDPVRTVRITSGKVLGTFPRPSSLKYRAYDESCNRIAAKYLGNTIANYFTSHTPKIINLLSMEKQEGKSYIAQHLIDNWTAQGLTVKHLNWETDFSAESKKFILAKSLKDIYQYHKEDIIIVEYPCLKENFIPGNLLQEAVINLCITKANRTWKDTDRILFDKLLPLTGSSPLFICLNYAAREIVESYTGVLPPYARIKTLGYRLTHFGFKNG